MRAAAHDESADGARGDGRRGRRNGAIDVLRGVAIALVLLLHFYLFHIVVLAAMRDLVPRDQLGYAFKLPWLLLFLAVSAGLAALVARYFSEPTNAALRSRFIAAHVPTRDARADTRAIEAESAG